MNKTCTSCNTSFQTTEREMGMYQKIGLVTPNICIQCRWKQHMAFWPFGKFRAGVSDLTGEKFITNLPENPRYPIYTSKEWWGDAWDPTSYGMDYDPSRPFFDQLKELQEKVPRPHQTGAMNINSDWADDLWECKNSYLCRSMVRGENLMYGYRAFDSKDSIDISHVFNLDQSYNCTYCFNCSKLFFSMNCKDCIDSAFLFDCRNSTNCFMSWNLRGKSFCIENVQYTKEGYFEKLKSYNLGSYEGLEKCKARYAEILRTQAVHRENFSPKTQNSVGTYMSNCNNCINIFGIEDSENCTNCLRGKNDKDCIDQTGCWDVQLSGNNSCCTNAYDLKYSIWCDGARYSEYCDLCLESEYCFGCVGLRKKKYCILNKQYTKEEYESLKGKIIEDMKARREYGAFPPYSLGLLPYNLSTASIYFPEVTKDYVLEHGGYWDEGEEKTSEGMPTSEIPDSIHDLDESFSKQALICPVTGWRFNISLDELLFLKRMNIAAPRVHFDVRTKERMQKLAPSNAEQYSCVFCSKDINAYYPKAWGYERVACEECYLKEIA